MNALKIEGSGIVKSDKKTPIIAQKSVILSASKMMYVLNFTFNIFNKSCPKREVFNLRFDIILGNNIDKKCVTQILYNYMLV